MLCITGKIEPPPPLCVYLAMGARHSGVSRAHATDRGERKSYRRASLEATTGSIGSFNVFRSPCRPPTNPVGETRTRSFLFFLHWRTVFRRFFFPQHFLLKNWKDNFLFVPMDPWMIALVTIFILSFLTVVACIIHHFFFDDHWHTHQQQNDNFFFWFLFSFCFYPNFSVPVQSSRPFT